MANGFDLSASLGHETVAPPFTAFNFAVEIDVSGASPSICNAAFSECDGLEMTMDVKTIREGGNNGSQIRLTGPVSYGTVTLKRGMTASTDLWKWFEAVVRDPSLRADGEVVVLAPDRSERARILLRRCVPLKVKAPPLNAKDGMVAIEELQLAYDSMSLRPGGASGLGVRLEAGIGVA
jgi:phage tail-like protein